MRAKETESHTERCTQREKRETKQTTKGNALFNSSLVARRRVDAPPLGHQLLVFFRTLGFQCACNPCAPSSSTTIPPDNLPARVGRSFISTARSLSCQPCHPGILHPASCTLHSAPTAGLTHSQRHPVLRSQVILFRTRCADSPTFVPAFARRRRRNHLDTARCMPFPVTCLPSRLIGARVSSSAATVRLARALAQPICSAGRLPQLHWRFSSANKSSAFRTISTRHNVSTTTTTTTITMSSRGKKKPSASTGNHVPPPEKDYQDITAPRPRRSSRRTGSASSGKDKGFAVVSTLSNLEKLREDGMSPAAAARKMDKKAKRALGAVDDAIESLEEMELAFKRDIKRRKLQVETSVISSHDTTDERASRPRMERAKSLVLQPNELLLSPERDVCDTEASAVNGLPSEEHEAQDDALEPMDSRGAKRAPAVNSDYLPLPWKGRLGYVRPSTPGAHAFV